MKIPVLEFTCNLKVIQLHELRRLLDLLACPQVAEVTEICHVDKRLSEKLR